MIKLYDNNCSKIEDDKSMSLEELEELALKGIRIAQFKMGLRYFIGKGFEQNHEKAYSWFIKSAKNGEARAINMAGNMLLSGDGVVKNESDAASWFNRGAKLNNDESQFYLALLYLYGRGVTKNISKGIELLILSCKNGNDDACKICNSIDFMN